MNTQLHDDDVAELNDLPDVHERIVQCAAVLDGYRLERAARARFVDKMIEFAIRSAREEAVLFSVGPDTSSPVGNGFPLLWGITWRARAAAWLLDHRQQIVDAIV